MTIEQIFEFSEPPKELNKETIRDQAGSATNFWNNCFKKEFQRMVFNQYGNIGATSLSYDFIKGTLHGLGLIEEWFRQQQTIIKNIDEKEEFNGE